MTAPAVNLRSHDERNYLTPGGVRVFARKLGSSLESDWKDLGDIEDPSFSQDVQTLQHHTTYHGVRKMDREIEVGRTMQWAVVLHEWNLNNLRFFFGSIDEPILTQSHFTVRKTKVVTNPGSGGEINLPHEDILAGSVVVRSTLLEEVDETIYVEDTDYSVDTYNGKITILAGGALATPDEAQNNEEIHILWGKSVESQAFEIAKGTEVEVELIFQMIDEDSQSLPWGLVVANGRILPNGDLSFGDGTDWSGIPLILRALADDDGNNPTLHLINIDEL